MLITEEPVVHCLRWASQCGGSSGSALVRTNWQERVLATPSWVVKRHSRRWHRRGTGNGDTTRILEVVGNTWTPSATRFISKSFYSLRQGNNKWMNLNSSLMKLQWQTSKMPCINKYCSYWRHFSNCCFWGWVSGLPQTHHLIMYSATSYQNLRNI